MCYIKRPYKYKEQLQKLKDRGCIINDDKKCISILESVNYYRFSAYFLPFKQSNGNYINGTSFEKVFNIYEFDRKLHTILFNALEEIEIFIRAKIAYYHAHKYGALGYLYETNFYNKNYNQKYINKIINYHKKFINNFQREIKSNEKVLFVKHHIDNYNSYFPIWVATEIFTFGMLSTFFANLKLDDRKVLAKDMYNITAKQLESWLRCCTDLRNICAHYGRLYYRIFSSIPKQMNNLDKNSERKLWGAILLVKELYPFKDKWNNEILPNFIKLINEYENDIDFVHIGFPKEWTDYLKK
ncbi:abortive phage infection protein [Brachyspira suanatina]|uniref:Abortive phage infection protein n=1 Tax=Brachyspira suanatina TaxID=381802 RepID=A0A0G4K459_9SPIR|nr:Abi family protein [Brachyspira suanatina]CRF31738.1 abortive phage infection protein [Brachyspira suanatina]